MVFEQEKLEIRISIEKINSNSNIYPATYLDFDTFFIFSPYFWPFCGKCDVYKLMVECIIDVLVANGLFYDILCRSKSQAKSLSRCQLPPNMMSFRQMKKDPLKIYCKGTKEFFLRHMHGSCNIRRVEIGVKLCRILKLLPNFKSLFSF